MTAGTVVCRRRCSVVERVIVSSRTDGRQIVETTCWIDVPPRPSGSVARGTAIRRNRTVPGGRLLIIVAVYVRAGPVRTVTEGVRRTLGVRGNRSGPVELLHGTGIGEHHVHHSGYMAVVRSRSMIRVALGAAEALRHRMLLVALAGRGRVVRRVTQGRAVGPRRSLPVVRTSSRRLNPVVTYQVITAHGCRIVGNRTYVHIVGATSGKLPEHCGCMDVYPLVTAVRIVTAASRVRMTEGADRLLLRIRGAVARIRLQRGKVLAPLVLAHRLNVGVVAGSRVEVVIYVPGIAARTVRPVLPGSITVAAVATGCNSVTRNGLQRPGGGGEGVVRAGRSVKSIMAGTAAGKTGIRPCSAGKTRPVAVEGN